MYKQPKKYYEEVFSRVSICSRRSGGFCSRVSFPSQVSQLFFFFLKHEVEARKRSWACRSVDVYMKLNNISEGAYGVVSRGQDKKTGAMVALKRLKMDRLGKDGFPLTALREINALLNLKHRNLTDLMEVSCSLTFLAFYV